MGRLEEIVKLVDKNKRVADIGSDHGITAIKIYEEKSPKEIIATDISRSSLQKLIDKLEYLNYNIKTMISDGISELPKDIEQIIISGMGGYLITDILEKGKDNARNAEKLILQANNSIDYLRKYLLDNSFEIIEEVITEDSNIIYYIIVASYRSNTFYERYTDVELQYGKLNIKRKDRLLIKDIESKIINYKAIIEKIQNINSKDSKRRIIEIKEDLIVLEDLLCELKN